MEEKQQGSRRRMLNGAMIVFDCGAWSLSCLVRSLSEVEHVSSSRQASSHRMIFCSIFDDGGQRARSSPTGVLATAEAAAGIKPIPG